MSMVPGKLGCSLVQCIAWECKGFGKLHAGFGFIYLSCSYYGDRWMNMLGLLHPKYYYDIRIPLSFSQGNGCLLFPEIPFSTLSLLPSSFDFIVEASRKRI